MPIDFKINEPDPRISCHYCEWEDNRAFVNGERAVKRMGRKYLPQANPDDTQAEYQAFLDRTRFLPAAAKIAQGLSGLIFRKQAQLNSASTRIQLLTQLITPDGQSLDDLAEWVVRETLITNFTGLLVDHPDRTGFDGLSAANEIEKGYRPRIAGYCGEAILEVTPGLVNNQRQIVRVRLSEDEGATIRELMLNNGVYQVRLWTRTDGGFAPGPITTPGRNGQPLSEIPFVLVSTGDKLTPEPSLLQHSVDLNLQHYRVQGLLTSVLYFLSAPIPVVTGLKPIQGADGKDMPINLSVAPGAAWVFPEPDTKAEYLEFSGAGASTITEELKNIKDELSTIGHSILAPEKPAPEAAETQMLRRAAENATLAGFTRSISRKLEKALKQFAQWTDPAASDLAYSLNTDFLPQQMSPQEMTALLQVLVAGKISHSTFLYALRDGEIVSPTLDVEAEIAATEQEAADRPPVL
ncbi:DUF4055 domain-containing protein [Sphingomonas sp. BAUL-RG-20F-R05-02]|uniref:DUF4055 domain-containing protein n=1 Tax=Sphingomonas sp. BAUL-RG-20F-R05-02 TaxID=2914830 RepID=UPI001F55C052|nr:DUF4055 domain-containing protein [Sphingomonas sp. BAUL-RG-20F-R05-02]